MDGTFLTRDPFPGFATVPYSQHPYQYGSSNPVSNTDPSGRCDEKDSSDCVNGPVPPPPGTAFALPPLPTNPASTADGNGSVIVGGAALVGVGGGSLTGAALTGAALVCSAVVVGVVAGVVIYELVQLPAVSYTQPVAVPLPLPIFTNEQASQAIKAAEESLIATAVAATGLLRNQFTILYRGLNYNRAYENSSEWLWTSENLVYAITVYAATDPFKTDVGYKDPAIQIYVIPKSSFQSLRSSGNILTPRDYRTIRSGVPNFRFLDQKESLEWVLDSFAQKALVGPIVIRLPKEFTGR